MICKVHTCVKILPELWPCFKMTAFSLSYVTFSSFGLLVSVGRVVNEIHEVSQKQRDYTVQRPGGCCPCSLSEFLEAFDSISAEHWQSCNHNLLNNQ